MQWNVPLSKTCIILLLLPQLMACAAKVQKEQQAILDSAVSQCDFATAVATPQPTESGFQVMINNLSPACDSFTQGKSYYAIVPIKPDSAIRINSEVYGPDLYFKPIIRFYDAHFNAGEKLIPQLQPNGKNYFWQERAIQSIVMVPADTAYLLIYTSPTFQQTWDTFVSFPGHWDSVKQGDHYVQRWTAEQKSTFNRAYTGMLTINYVDKSQ
ncbi:hypothetical protein [Shewanella sp.]|uniref:hypothetical protein n=1 Tax=Shewanella sp. TaxID=50422 RepID=UPI003A985E94